ncbi:MAG: alpha/beta family hydrolase [Syntrophobacteraceae bacterium]
MRVEKVVIPVGEKKQVSGVLTVPEDFDGRRGLILAHGAGNDMHQAMIVALAEALGQGGCLTLRFNFLYREEGRNSPDRPEVLYQAWEGAYRFLSEHARYRPNDIIAAGKSLGGRIASQLVAENRLPVKQLIFLGYPLHPAGKPEKLRDEHLYQIGIPMLFIAGTRDPLCGLELLKTVLVRLKAPWTLETIENGDHSFYVPKSYGVPRERIHAQIVDWVVQWLDASSS